MSLLLQSALILLREGLEAILVLAALAALLRRMAPERMGALWGGAGLGVVASLVTAGAYLAWRDGVHDDTVEGVTCLAAAALMLWTGGFLWRRADPRAWAATLRSQAEAALASRRVPLALGVIGFLAVYREGAETALFLAALRGEGSLAGLLGGVALGAVALGVLWVVVMRAAVKLPLGPLFRVTSLFLAYMAVRLVAAGIGEFQEQAMLSFTPTDWPEWTETLGLAASWEGVVAQALVAGLAAAVAFWPQRAVPAPAAAE